MPCHACCTGIRKRPKGHFVVQHQAKVPIYTITCKTTQLTFAV